MRNDAITFNSVIELAENGFVGFKRIADVILDYKQLPKEKGVYLILNLNHQIPIFLPTGTGGYFKGKDPNVTVVELESQWVKDSMVIYIGKAGSADSKATLRSRLTQYFKFGLGQNIGHWGGRLIWQIKDAPELVICWKELPNDDPREYERQLISRHVSRFGKMPFANLIG